MALGTRRAAGRPAGQALVEFALILIVLLLIIFVLVEAARILFAYATLQNAVRSGARYGITGQYDADLAADPLEDPRVQSIKNRVRSNANGLQIDAAAGPDDPYYFHVEVWGADGSGGSLIEDFAGISRWPLRVRARYRLPMITPLTIPIARSIALNAEVVMNNEAFDQIAGSRLDGDAIAPPIPEPLEADLAVEASPSDDPVRAGEPFEYNLTITNGGPLPATNVILTADLDPGLAFMSTLPPDVCSRVDDRLTCPLDDMPNGDTQLFVIRVRADAAGMVEHSVQISGDQHDPYLANNVAHGETIVE